MANSLTGTIIAEKYRLGEVQRSGVQGDLYDARHVLMDKPASIFVLRPSLAVDRENVEKFFAEAKTSGNVSSSHVLSLSDFGTDRDGYVYAVYESLTGTPLKQVILADGAFPVHSAVDIAHQVAEGLFAAHAVGQVHGNLMAGNIYLTGENGINAKVTDFGSPNPIIAECTEAADFAYLSPGQCSGSEKSDERSDVYSLGVILYEMLAGVPPFAGERPTDVMVKHIEEMPAPLSAFRTDVPEDLESIILKALSKNPEMRHQTAQEFADELLPLYTEIPRAVAAPQNNLWKTAFVVLVGMSLLGAFMIYGTYTKQTDPTTALQPDAGGMPVQPINPATGTEEQSLASMPALTVDAIANANLSQPPGTLSGGDNYNPWGSGAPPPGAPDIQPGGQVVTVGPAVGNPLMPSGILYDASTGRCVDAGTYETVQCPRDKQTDRPANTPVATPKPSVGNVNASPANSRPGNSNSASPKPSPPPTNRATNTPTSGDRSN